MIHPAFGKHIEARKSFVITDVRMDLHDDGARNANKYVPVHRVRYLDKNKYSKLNKGAEQCLQA